MTYRLDSIDFVMAAIGRDWLGKDNEIQFFFHSSRSEPLYVVGVGDTSRYTIQVEVKSLRGNEVRHFCTRCFILDHVCFIAK